ncbi:MAG: DoxX family protein [Rhodanobacter sp.]
MRSRRSRWLLALFFAVAGMLHFILMPSYMSVMPRWLGSHRALVIISGVCEIAGGMGVLWSGTRRWAGYGLIALCVAVLPANVQMLLDARTSHAPALIQTLLWMRLPLQGLLVWWIWHVTRGRAAG